MKNLENTKRIIAGIIACSIFSSTLYAQIWKQAPLHRLTYQEYEMTLDFWGEKYKDLLTVERVGDSAEGMGIFLLKITDGKIADDTKQVALITSLHGGPERSPTTTALTLTEWLLSDDMEAVETRRKQIVLIMPIINPYSYFVTERFGNSKKIDPYTGGGAQNWDFEKLIYKNPDEAPEVMAFLKVVDTYQPDVHLDLHGTGLQEYNDEQLKENNHLSYRGQIMVAITGTSYSNSVLRPWDWRITEAMVTAGKEAGFPSDRAEADAQQMQWIPGIEQAAGKEWRGRPRFYTAQYAYMKYHTLLVCSEVSWESGGVACAKGLLRIGNQIWQGEKRPGYPVNKVNAFVGCYVTSWGNTAKELRESRIELWQKQSGFSHGTIYPVTEGRETFVVSLTSKGSQIMDADLASFVANLRKDLSIDANAIESFIKKGPEIKLVFEHSQQTGLQQEFIERGLGFRLRIQYADAKIEKLRLNGHLLQPSSTDGYETWIGDGFLQVQINVPPFKASKMDIAVVTCEYNAKTKRNYGWKPPEEVMEKIEKK